MKSTTRIATTVAILSGAADAFWRMECRGRTGLARIDPLVEPGVVAHHAHAIHGGSNFGLETDFNDLVKSDCTSCMVEQDMSAYWTPSLHFIHDDGKAEIVGQAGGMLVYYLLPGEEYVKEKPELYKVKPFPEGFRILAGDTRQRNFTGPFPDIEKALWGKEDKSQASLAQKAIGFNCMNYDLPGEPTAYRHFLPDKQYLDQHCKDGIRAEIYFPSCWDGEHKDSDNHKDHMAYPDLVNAGECPKSHPIQLPMLLYETIWETNAFNGKSGQFTFANGDPTGYGYHADFIMGWKDGILEDAVSECTDREGLITNCPVFTQNGAKLIPGMDGGFLQTEEKMRECKFDIVEILDNDNCKGPADALCGNVEIFAGPEYAPAGKPGNEAKPTPGYTPGPSATPEMPVLSYTTPKSVVNGISVFNAHDAGAESPVVEVQNTPVQTTPAAVPEPEAPAPTPAPEPEHDGEGSIISTKTITSAGTVYEVAIEEVVVYVTVDPAQPPVKQRRHVHHKHHRRDREHGLLGRY